MKPHRILLADDHAMLLDMMRGFLEPEFEVVGTVNDGIRLVEQALASKPDLVIADISMPGLNGLAAGEQLRRELPSTRLLYITMNSDIDLAIHAFRIGAAGYVLKSSAASELLAAVREVMAGRTYLTERIAGGDIAALTAKRDVSPVSLLSEREREVIQLLAKGHPMKRVAGMLGITPRTVAFHKYRCMKLLNLRSNAELVRYAIQHGMVQM